MMGLPQVSWAVPGPAAVVPMPTFVTHYLDAGGDWKPEGPSLKGVAVWPLFPESGP